MPFLFQTFNFDLTRRGGIGPLSISLFPCTGRVHWVVKRDGHLVAQFQPQYDTEIKMDIDSSEDDDSLEDSLDDDDDDNSVDGNDVLRRRKRPNHWW